MSTAGNVNEDITTYQVMLIKRVGTSCVCVLILWKNIIPKNTFYEVKTYT